jgi:AcrR family transcriptional regulator
MTNRSASTNGLSRRERERKRRRQAMLRAARSVFAEKGYAQATIDEVAERAEFGKGTLYNYFEGGKEDLLFAILDEVHDDIHSTIQQSFTSEAASKRSLRTCYHTLVTNAFAFFSEHEDLFMVLMKESHRLCFSENAEHVAYFQRQQERMVDALIPALEQGVERGAIRAFPPRAVAHMMLENINGMLVHRAMMDRDEACGETMLHAPEKAADLLTTMLFDGLIPKAPVDTSTDDE